MVVGSSPAGGVLAEMCECINASHLMRLHIRHHLFHICGVRTWVDCSTVRTHNQLENESVRTAGKRYSYPRLEFEIGPRRAMEDCPGYPEILGDHGKSMCLQNDPFLLDNRG